MDIEPALELLTDWVPARVYIKNSEPFVDWCYMGPERFTQPFFDDTIERRFQQPFNLLFRYQTPFRILERLYEDSPGINPTGFIFHMSRCGSTLVAQMLAALEKNIVISEASPIDVVLRLDSKISVSDADRRIWLQWVISALGQKRRPDEENYFIKFDCWSTLDLRLIRETFPDVPWIFIYRNPVEVIVSHMRQRGWQMIPGTLEKVLPDTSIAEALQMAPEEYCARVLARICETALDYAKDKNALLINYDQLPGAVTNSILNHFRISSTDDEIERMRAVTSFHAKSPRMFFTPDQEEKRKNASEAEVEATNRWLDRSYRLLEQMRSTELVAQ
jgi:gluconate kinase